MSRDQRRLAAAALEALLAHPEISPSILRGIQARQIVRRQTSGLLALRVVGVRSVTLYALDRAQSRAVDHYLTGSGLWESSSPLFAARTGGGYTEKGWQSVVYRLRRRRRVA